MLVHGPPACGKSTLAIAIRRKYPYTKERARNKERSYVYVAAHDLERAIQTSTFDQELIKYLNREDNLNGDLEKDLTPSTALAWLAERNIAVIIDEAHVFFDTEKMPTHKYIYTAFLKNGAPNFTALFFTSSSGTISTIVLSDSSSQIGATPAAASKDSHSPSQMNSKWFWSGEFDTKNVITALKTTNVKLSPSATEAVVQISGLNRGVCTCLFRWVSTKQKATPCEVFWREFTVT